MSLGPGTRARLLGSLILIVAAVTAGSFHPTPAQAVDENPIVIENRNPGTDQWRLGRTGYRTANDAAGQIKGYAGATSVNKTGSITFYVTVNPVQTYTVDIYRMGWYGGTGGRLLQQVGPLAGVAQPACPIAPATGLTACSWSPGYTLTVPDTWTSGVYLALLTNAEKYQNYITFVVRDDARPADLLFPQSVTTYQAYNRYPDDGKTGKSLYPDSYGSDTIAGDHRAVKVSFDRPYSRQGLGRQQSVEIGYLRWLERSGYDVTYSTSVDTHANGDRLLKYRGVLSAGHDEYWSKQMYDAAATARDFGVSLGFFGANDVYWQFRFEASASSAANRVMVCYKSSALDPVQGPMTTNRWRQAPANRPEQDLIGIQSTAALTTSYPYVVTNSSSWVYTGTGLRDGDKVPGIVAGETDRRNGAWPLPTYRSYVRLSNSPLLTNRGERDHAESSVYQAPSGAWVFAAGTIQWTRGLDDFPAPGYVDARIQRMTANILDRFVAPDRLAPTGTVTINRGAILSKTTLVSVAAPASDDQSVVSQVRMSNRPEALGGILSFGKTYSYKTPISWNLADSGTGGSNANGTRAVYVQWRDGHGNWSQVVRDSIVLDTSAPVSKAPSQVFVAPSTLGASAVPVVLTWSARDSRSGIRQYDLQQSTNGGPYARVALPAATTTRLRRLLAPGSVYHFRIRAYDAAGNVSPWALGPGFTVNAYQETSGAIAYAGTWKKATMSGTYGGSVRYATVLGARARLPFTGRGVAWVAVKGRDRGAAQVWVDGVRAKTVDLYSATTRTRQLVYSRSWAVSGSHTIEIRVVRPQDPATTRRRVDVDAFVKLR